eukprot:54421_1
MGLCFTMQDVATQKDANDPRNHMELSKAHHDRGNHPNDKAVTNIRDIMKDRAQERLDYDVIGDKHVIRSDSTFTNLCSEHKSESELNVSEDPPISVPSVASSEALYDIVSEKETHVQPIRAVPNGQSSRLSSCSVHANKTNSKAEGIIHGITFEMRSVNSEGVVNSKCEAATEMIEEAR